MEELPQALDAQEPLLPSDLKILLEEYENNPAPQTKFNLAWALVRSLNKNEQRRGVDLLNEIYIENPTRRRECLYYLALGEFKLGNYKESRSYTETLLQIEPSNKQALQLRDQIQQTVQQEGLFGMAIVGGLVTIVGAIAAVALGGSKRK
ncbi:hypothetical protein BC833DRAFT_600395 [Globomyces pollinis-pini]|nr:hypothetical protein BC833DRAFT_600395 [Globomyces pollinis-pini]